METRLVIIRATWGPKPHETKTKLVYGRVDPDGKTRIAIDAYKSLIAKAPRGVGIWFN